MALSESDCESQQGKQMDQACDFVPSEGLPMIDEQAGINIDDDEIIGVSSQPREANDRSWVLAPDTQDIKNPSQESLRSFVSDRSVQGSDFRKKNNERSERMSGRPLKIPERSERLSGQS